MAERITVDMNSQPAAESGISDRATLNPSTIEISKKSKLLALSVWEVQISSIKV